MSQQKTSKVSHPKTSTAKVSRPKVSQARWAAYQILLRVERENAYTSYLLPLYENDLKPDDRALCHELTLGVIRNQLFLDTIIEHFTKKKLTKLDAAVLIALRMGIYQMRFMRIPARAAINESVEIVKKEKLMSASGFVNGVLRSIDRETDFDPAAKFSGLEKLSVHTSHPLWLLEKWQEEFGAEETAKLATVNNGIPKISFRVNRATGENVLTELHEAGIEFVESQMAPGCFNVTRAGKFIYEMAEQGHVVLQDEASQMVASLVGLKTGESFLDVCAAPGNKTTQIISSVESDGNEFYAAGDLHEHRLETLRRNLAIAQIENVKVLNYDATGEMPFEPETFDAILLDAPCSGTGTIRHNPEIRWSLSPADIPELVTKQSAILRNVAKLLKPGGRIIYSTCSLEEEENEKVIENFLGENENFRADETHAPKELITGRGFVRTFPQRDNTDGFFAAVLRKK